MGARLLSLQEATDSCVQLAKETEDAFMRVMDLSGEVCHTLIYLLVTLILLVASSKYCFSEYD